MGSSAAYVYLDWNSTSKPLPEVLAAMQVESAELWGNPASVHGPGRRARRCLEQAREVIADCCEFHPRDMVFTGGGTEANNLALAGDGPLVVSRLEHPSITRVADARQVAGGRVVWLPVSEDGTLSIAQVETALQQVGPGGTLAVTAANHETGVIQDVQALGALAKRYQTRLHVDAVQWLGKRPMSELSLADSLSVTAHKLGGPKGVGALLFRGSPPNPVLRGGAQERGVRPGTQDAVAALGFARALECMDPQQGKGIEPLRDELERRLACVASVNGGAARLPHVSNLSFLGWPGPELVAALDLQGICVSSGSACSAGTSEPSPVITAMFDEKRAGSAVRFSLGRDTSATDIERVADALSQLLAEPAR